MYEVKLLSLIYCLTGSYPAAKNLYWFRNFFLEKIGCEIKIFSRNKEIH